MNVVFDPKVFIDAARVVTCRQNQSSQGAAASDDSRNRGRRHQSTASNQQLSKAVCDCHVDDYFYCFAIVVATVSTDHQHVLTEVSSGFADNVKNGLHSVLEIVWLHEDACFLAQP